MNQFRYLTMLGWSSDYGTVRQLATYLVQLHLLQAVVSLRLVLHVEDLGWSVSWSYLDQFERHEHVVLDAFGPKDIRELALACCVIK